MDDIATVHALGVKVVVVLGAAPLINQAVRLRGHKPSFHGGYRMTDEIAMEAATEAAGTSRTLIEALLSKVRQRIFFPEINICFFWIL